MAKDAYEIGHRNGMLTVISDRFSIQQGKYVRPAYDVRCDCGNEKVIISFNIARTRTCGCIDLKLKHGDTITMAGGGKKKPCSLYSRWALMKDRCCNPNNYMFHRYGGRGIFVCDEWRHNYIAFREWALANGYDESLQNDRVDNDGPYCPENCRWVTSKQNANNRSDCKTQATRPSQTRMWLV